MTQDDAARWFKVPRDLYKRWESGRYEGPWVLLGSLELHEECYVLRRRARMSRRDLANAVGVSLTWVTQMERGRAPIDRLVTYWSQHQHESRSRRCR
jgi:DNA-binding XRE family transcriptional regulator